MVGVKARVTRRPRSMKLQAYVITWILKMTLRITRRLIFMRVEVRGDDPTPKDKAAGLVCNHPSVLDPLLLAAVTKRNGACMAKAELWDSWFSGWLVRMGGHIPVDRGSDEGRALAFALLDWIFAMGGFAGGFPQGGTAPNRWNKGIFELFIKHEIPFLIVWLGGTNDVLPANAAEKAAMKASRPRWLRWLPAINPWAKIRVNRAWVTPEEYAGMNAEELAAYAQKRCEDLAFV